jgi:hypothetical protein
MTWEGSSLAGLENHETEDGGGERYKGSSDESVGGDTANVSDFDNGNPKDAPHFCFFGKDECRSPSALCSRVT